MEDIILMNEKDKNKVLEISERIRAISLELKNFNKRKEALGKTLAEMCSSITQLNVEQQDLQKVLKQLCEEESQDEGNNNNE